MTLRSAIAFAVGLLAVLAVLAAAFLHQRDERPTGATGTTPTVAFTPPPLAVFIGDSYSAGVGATTEQKRWVNRVAYAEGWTFVNLSNGGTGYVASSGRAGCGEDYCPPYRGVLDDVQRLQPAIVVVSGGRNDLAATDARIDAAVDAFYPALRAAAPRARIIALSPLWDDSAPPARITALGSVVQTAVQGVGGRYLDLGQPLRGEEDYVVGDSVHPSDLGHGVIADAVIAALAGS